MDDDRWRDIGAREQRSAGLRHRFGLDDRGDQARDWLTGAGAVPFTLAVVALVVYAVISIVVGAVR